MNIKFRNGLLYTSLEVIYKGKSKIINDVIIDTGATHSIICPDAVEDLNFVWSSNDMLVTMYGIGGEQYAYRKEIDCIKFGECSIDNYKLDFGYMDDLGRIQGLLGLDLLMKMGIVLDLKNLNLFVSE